MQDTEENLVKVLTKLWPQIWKTTEERIFWRNTKSSLGVEINLTAPYNTLWIPC